LTNEIETLIPDPDCHRIQKQPQHVVVCGKKISLTGSSTFKMKSEMFAFNSTKVV